MASIEINISISGDGLVTGLNINEHPVPGGIVASLPRPIPACSVPAASVWRSGQRGIGV